MIWPITGSPSEVLPILGQRVRQYQTSINVGKFYIGRTYNTTARGDAHGAEGVERIYQTSSATNVVRVEGELIRRFRGTAKCDNDSPRDFWALHQRGVLVLRNLRGQQSNGQSFIGILLTGNRRSLVS